MIFQLTVMDCMELLAAGLFMGLIIGAAISTVAHKE